MPRIYNDGRNVEEFCEATGEGSSTYDICHACAKKLDHNPHAFDSKLTPYNGDPVGDAGWGGDAEHPPYDDEDYECEICGKHLNDRNA